MHYFLDLMYQLLASPRRALRVVTRGEQLRQAGALWLFTAFLLSLTSFVEGPGLAARFLVTFVLMGTALFLHGAVVDYSAGFLGGRGTARGITAGFMAASFPYAFSVFGGLFDMLLGFGGEALGTVLFLWSFVLDVIAVSENYGFSTGKALLTALIPAILFAAVFLCLFAAGLMAALSGIAAMEDLSAVEGVIQSL